MEEKITREKLDKYFRTTKAALDKIKEIIPLNTHLDQVGKDFLEMATNYFKDAEHFYKKGERVTAFAALNYAHGWLDAGARLGLWDVGHDSNLFTVEEENER